MSRPSELLIVASLVALSSACGARTELDPSSSSSGMRADASIRDASPPDVPSDAGPEDGGESGSRCRLSTGGGESRIVFRAAEGARIEGPEVVWGSSHVDLLAVERDGAAITPLWRRYDESLEGARDRAFPLEVAGPLSFSGLRHACFESPSGTSVVQFPPSASSTEATLPPGGCLAIANTRALQALPDEAGQLAPQWIGYELSGGSAGPPEIASAVRGDDLVAAYAPLAAASHLEAWAVARPADREAELSVHYVVRETNEVYVTHVAGLDVGSAGLAITSWPSPSAPGPAVLARGAGGELVLVVSNTRAEERLRIPLGVRDALGDGAYSAHTMLGFVFTAALVYDESDPSRGTLHVVVVDSAGTPPARTSLPVRRPPGEPSAGDVTIQADNSPTTLVHWTDWLEDEEQHVSRALRISCSDFRLGED